MNIEAEKIELLKLILETEDETITQELKIVLKSKNLTFGTNFLIQLKKASIVVWKMLQQDAFITMKM